MALVCKLLQLAMVVGCNGQTKHHYFDYENILRYYSHEGFQEFAPGCNDFELRMIFMKQIPNGSTIEAGPKICRMSASFDTCEWMYSWRGLFECLSDAWYCIIPSSEICNGHSICLTDECECVDSDKTLFLCADGIGCVTIDRTCNGFYDCLDRSDEFLCIRGYRI